MTAVVWSDTGGRSGESAPVPSSECSCAAIAQADLCVRGSRTSQTAMTKSEVHPTGRNFGVRGHARGFLKAPTVSGGPRRPQETARQFLAGSRALPPAASRGRSGRPDSAKNARQPSPKLAHAARAGRALAWHLSVTKKSTLCSKLSGYGGLHRPVHVDALCDEHESVDERRGVDDHLDFANPRHGACPHGMRPCSSSQLPVTVSVTVAGVATSVVGTRVDTSTCVQSELARLRV